MLECIFRMQNLDREHDVPYLAGYSVDGTTLYIDRHLPDVIKCEEDGHRIEFDPVPFLRAHESWEKALIDGRDFTYAAAHQAATAIEHRRVLAAGIPISVYDGKNSKLMKYIKADSHEKLKRIPKELDLNPYYSDKSLLNHLMEKIGMNTNKETKEEAGYESLGRPAEHCGGCEGWPVSGECHNFIDPNQCLKVKGTISPKGWCNYWEKL